MHMNTIAPANSLLTQYLESLGKKPINSAAAAFYASLDHISSVSPSVVESIIKEFRDQRQNLKLIASENYSSLATQLAHGNLLTDKYAEGYPNHRFYAGCDNSELTTHTKMMLCLDLSPVV